MTMKVALYARCSTNHQETENQLIELRRYVKARGWSATEFVDKGLSGAKSEADRPALKALMERAKRKEFGAVVVWDFSRFARSMKHLIEALETFKELDIAFLSLREGINTNSANGRLIFGIFASLAEFERELTKQRVLLGLERARENGKRLGRPGLKVDLEKLNELHSNGLSLRQIGRKMGVSRETVRRLIEVSQKP